MVHDRSLFTKFEATNTGESGVNPNGSLADMKGEGTVEALIANVKGIERMYEFHDVLFVPSYNVNLMSVSRVEAKGNTLRVTNRSFNVVKTRHCRCVSRANSTIFDADSVTGHKQTLRRGQGMQRSGTDEWVI